VYGVWHMRRTNVYLSDEQLSRLRLVGERRGVPVATLVREAIDSWLAEHGVEVVSEDEWKRRFDELLGRRRRVAAAQRFVEADVSDDVARAVRAVREARTARRR
jgi:hypothetical protein